MSIPLPSTFGDYLLLHVLGRGGHGTAYLALALGDPAPPSPLVVKLLHGGQAQETPDRSRFEHEAKLALAMNIDALATVYDAGLAGETAYIAMELVRGMSLSRLLATLREFDAVLGVPDVLNIIGSALEGVKALHEAKDQDGRPLEAIHRDLSPNNLMLDPEGRVRILDLGVGRSRLREQQTATGVIIGTPGYMSPEQTLGAPISQRSDVYTLGAIFWELLAGRRYIPRGELAMVLAETVKRVYEPPSLFRPGLSPQIDDVCRRALDRDPERRFASSAELLREINALKTLPGERMSGKQVAALSDVYQLDLDDEELEELLDMDPRAATRLLLPETRIERIRLPSAVTVRNEVAPPVAETMMLPARAPKLHALVFVAPLVLAAVVLGSALLFRARTEPMLVIPLDRDPVPVSIQKAPGIAPREVEEPELEAPIVEEKRARPATPPLKKIEEQQPAPEPSAEELMTALQQLARSVKKARPELGAQVDDLINTGLFETATGDTPAVRARLKEISAAINKLKASAEKRGAPRDP